MKKCKLAEYSHYITTQGWWPHSGPQQIGELHIFCSERKIAISAVNIPGVENAEADEESGRQQTGAD